MNLNKKLILLGLCIPLVGVVGCSTETEPNVAEMQAAAVSSEIREDGLTDEDFLLLSAMKNQREYNLTLIETETDSIYEWFILPEEFRYIGTFNWNNFRWTYYSERVLPGGGLNIPGRWSDTYFVRDGEGNICLASFDYRWGTYLPTPWGQGRVYDSGCASGTLDVYVTW